MSSPDGETFQLFEKLLGNFLDFGGKFFSRIFWGNFLGNIFWEDFLGKTYWEDFLRGITW